MGLMDKMKALDLLIEEVRVEISTSEDKLETLISRREAIEYEINEPNFKNIEWLINNPQAVGQHDSLREWMADNFGGEYEGISAFGYYPDTNQQCFGFVLSSCEGDAVKAKAEVERYAENIKKFASMTIHLMEAQEDGFVGFTYCTGSHSGIFEICYKPEDQTWWTRNTQYYQTLDLVQRESLQDAIDFAIVNQSKIDD